MRKIKVSYMGKYLKDIYPHATRFQVLRYKFNKFMEKLIAISAAIALFVGMLYGSFKAGQATTQANTTHANILIPTEVIKEVRPNAKVMDNIAKCESGGKHFDKNGKVIFNKNTNGTLDVGKYQINTLWLPTMAEMKLNINDEKDNETFAYWIYENRGTQDWYASANCWR